LRGHSQPSSEIGAPQFGDTIGAGEQSVGRARSFGPQPRLALFARETHQHRQRGAGGEDEALAHLVMDKAEGQDIGHIGQRQALARGARQQQGGGDGNGAARFGEGEAQPIGRGGVRQFQGFKQREDRHAGATCGPQIVERDRVGDQPAVSEKGRKGEPVSGLTGALGCGVAAE
jgi:hypothetical protein